MDTLYKQYDQREIVIGKYFDLTKAFDTVDHNTLLYKLSNCGVRGNAVNWFKSYFSNRQQFMSQQIPTIVLQGSVLGPLLFLLCINDINNSCTDCTVRLCADDTNMFVYDNKNVHDAYCKANQALFKLHNCFYAN